MISFVENLSAAVNEHGPLCVGLDPRVDCLPRKLQKLPSPDAVLTFCNAVLEIVRPHCGVIKPQSAFFEQLGWEGFRVLQSVMDRARELGYVIILDAKRGDIASTAEAYANAAFEVLGADAVTVNPWLGDDAVEPFIRKAQECYCGVFVLVRTSNPGSGLFQNLVSGGRYLYRHVAEKVVEWNATFGNVGAVIGATHPKELAELRAAMPGVWFLVPGYGPQGGSAADVRPAYPQAIVNSSRGVTFPFQPDDADWEKKIENAARTAAADLKQ